MARRLTLTLFLLWLAAALVSATGPLPSSQDPAATASIAGRVVDASSARPAGGVLVKLSTAGAQPVETTTDRNGAFSFSNLRQASYALTAASPDHLEGAYARLWPGGLSATLRVALGEDVEGVEFRVWQHAAIAGSVLSPDRVPFARTVVRALQARWIGGQVRYLVAGQATTDDRGLYRIGGLAPGPYRVGIVTSYISIPETLVGRLTPEIAVSEGIVLFGRPPGPADGVQVGGFLVSGLRQAPRPVAEGDDVLVHTSTFFPGMSSITGAIDVSLAAGDQREAIDFVWTPVRGVRLSGTLAGEAGPPPPMSLQLIPREVDDRSLAAAVAVSDANGSFAFLGVPPGTYVLRGQLRSGAIASGGNLSGGDFHWAMAEVVVGDRPIEDLLVQSERGHRMEGRVIVRDGEVTRLGGAALARVRVALEADDGPRGAPGLFGARVGEDGRFTTPPVPGGSYFIRVTDLPAGWGVASLTMGSADYADRPLLLRDDIPEVVVELSDGMGTLTGKVQAAARDLLSGGVLLVFPADRATWSTSGREPRGFRAVAVGRDGEFEVTGLPAGEYLAAALASPRVDSDWMAPEVLERLRPRALAVRVGRGRTPLAPPLLAGWQ